MPQRLYNISATRRLAARLIGAELKGARAVYSLRGETSSSKGDGPKRDD